VRNNKMAFNSVVIQDLTYTETSLGDLISISYVNGGLAGFETVTVTNNTLITVQIQDGISTATQIKAAVDANYIAHRLATVAISGTGSNAQVTVNAAQLSGGTPLASATLVVGSTMLLTAVTAGTAGNAVTFAFTGGATAGSEVVTVVSNAISVQIADGGSTYQQVVTAVNGSGAAAALVTASSAGKSLSGSAAGSINLGILPAVSTPPEGVAYVAHMPSATNLFGGTAATAAFVTVQGVTFTWNATGTVGNSQFVTYTTGATAGAEVVSVSGNTTTVQIQNGVSTAAQIDAAVDTFGGNLLANGSSSSPQFTVNQLTMCGGSGASTRQFYRDQTIAVLTTSYQQFTFPDQAQTLVIKNDETSGSKNVIYSFDNFNTAGKVLPTEALVLDDLNGIGGISLKEENGAPAYRLEVVGK
jgi:hypothetical protein